MPYTRLIAYEVSRDLQREIPVRVMDVPVMRIPLAEGAPLPVLPPYRDEDGNTSECYVPRPTHAHKPPHLAPKPKPKPTPEKVSGIRAVLYRLLRLAARR